MRLIYIFFLALILLICGGLPATTFAQVRPQYSQYMLNNYLLNPAITGIEDYLDLKMSFRTQWTGIEGAPTTYYVTAHTRLGHNVNIANPSKVDEKQHAFAPKGKRYNAYKKIKPHHGIGGMILHDRIGVFSTTEAMMSYAYHILISPEIKLSGGIAAGVSQYSMRGSDLRLANPNDNLATNIIITKPIVSAGLWLYASQIYAGLGITQLAGNTFDFGGNTILQNPSVRHYFATFAYKILVGEKFTFIPSFLAKVATPLPISMDYNLRVLYTDRIWLGVSYRRNNDFIFMAGLHLNNAFDLSYSYDMGRNQINKQGIGSHEVILGIRLNNRFGVYCPVNMW
ncbi:MAG: type IX secretion system membrane protein PorP/SprF [Thermoflexibacter sp.]|jgi:type IX secretion system PorP/SprF family membrane protein|nr:type IX secretion system membrane protein PorP/SprF [Thermoflexibacter sp.]